MKITKDLNRDLTRYSKFVMVSKVTLSFFIICLIISLVIIPWFSKVNRQFQITTINQDNDESTNMPQMTKPKFQGIDNKGNPYTILADRAIQESLTYIKLENIKADLMGKDNNWLSVHAEKGEIEIKKQEAKLLGNVSILSGNGFEIHVSDLYISFLESMAHTNNKVQVTSLPFTLTAQGFSIYEAGKIIDFNGPVNVKIYPKQGKRKNDD